MFLKRRTKDRKKHINLSPLFICTNYQHKIQMRLNKILNYIHSFKRMKRLKTNPPQPDDTQADSVLFFLFHKIKIKRLKYRPSLLCTIPHVILTVQSWVFTAWEKESFFLSSAVTRRWPPPSPWSSNVAHVCGGYMSGSLPDNAMKWGGGGCGLLLVTVALQGCQLGSSTAETESTKYHVVRSPCHHTVACSN